jgi:hypothetical protein
MNWMTVSAWAIAFAGLAPSPCGAQTVPVERAKGQITSFPLPPLPDAPFSSVLGSKHTNMAYCPLNDRLYVSGGDWTRSATDGTWSMDMKNGSWRKDVGDPVYPTLPAPSAAQDGMGFVWDAKRRKFLFWPGSYFAYDYSIKEYARGLWFFDPMANTWTQELGLWGAAGHGAGSIFGGIYDEKNDEILTLHDDSTSGHCRRWSVGQLKQLPTLYFSIPKPAGQAAYFANSQHARIDRAVYVVGVTTNGGSDVRTGFWKWGMDDHTFTALPPPPVDPKRTKVDVIEVRLAPSDEYVVWPFMNGPEGTIHGIYRFNVKTGKWTVDTQVPSYGNFLANSVAALPDGRIVMGGSCMGNKQQTHLWFYKP